MTPRPPAPLAARSAMRALHLELGGTVKFTTWVLVRQTLVGPNDWIAFARDANGFMYYSTSMNTNWVVSRRATCRKGWEAWIARGAVQAEV